MYEEGPDGKPIVTGLRMRRAGEDSMVHGDCYVAALDCQGAKKLVPDDWRKFPLFDNIHKLEGVPVITVQLRCALISTIASSGVQLLSKPSHSCVEVLHLMGYTRCCVHQLLDSCYLRLRHGVLSPVHVTVLQTRSGKCPVSIGCTVDAQ